MIRRTPIATKRKRSLDDLLNGLGNNLFIEEDISDFENLDDEVLVLGSNFHNLHDQMLQTSCSFFAFQILQGPGEAPYNGKFLINDHHLEWDNLIAARKRVCILAARDHGKSFYCNFAYPIWKAVYLENACGYIFSNTQPQAERILELIKDEIESNSALQYLVPKKRDRWGARQIKLANNHRIYARGFGTKIRGGHPVWIVVDDGLTDETLYSEIVRRKQIDFFFSAITNMITPGGQILVIGTPFHQRDLYSELKSNPEYVYKEYPAESNPGNPNNKALWPDRYSLDLLAAKAREIGPIRYAREFLVRAISDDMSLFPDKLFRGEPTEQYMVVLGLPLSFWKDKGVSIYIGVDFAISSTVEADYTVIAVMGKDTFGNRWIIDLFRDKGMPYQMQLSKIQEYGKRYDPNLIFVEANQMQRIFGDELIRTTDLPIQKFTTGIQKNSLEKGIPEIRVLLENGKFRIPRGDTRSIEMTNLLIEEFRNMSFIDGKIQSVGAHDDIAMAVWLCNQAIKFGGFNFAFGDKEASIGNGEHTTASVIDNRRIEIINKIKDGRSITCKDMSEYTFIKQILEEFVYDTDSEAWATIAENEAHRLALEWEGF